MHCLQTRRLDKRKIFRRAHFVAALHVCIILTTNMRYLALVTTIILLLFRPCNSQRQLEQCVIDLGLEQQSIILGGQTVSSRDNPIVFLEQHRNGNLVVKRGRAIVWKSGITDISSTQTCFTRLQNDGHMLTFANSSASNHHAVWKTNSHGPTSSNYFLGMDCNFQQVGIYQGSSDNPGDSIWREPTSLYWPNLSATCHRHRQAIMSSLHSMSWVTHPTIPRKKKLSRDS